MSKDRTLAQDVEDIRQIVKSLEEKVDQILLIMETFVELQDSEYDNENDDEDDFESNEGWISDVEWFADDSDEED